MDIRVTEDELNLEKGGGVWVSALNFKGQSNSYADIDPTQILIFVAEGKLQVRVWTGDEDPTHEISIDRALPEDCKNPKNGEKK